MHDDDEGQTSPSRVSALNWWWWLLVAASVGLVALVVLAAFGVIPRGFWTAEFITSPSFGGFATLVAAGLALGGVLAQLRVARAQSDRAGVRAAAKADSQRLWAQWQWAVDLRRKAADPGRYGAQPPGLDQATKAVLEHVKVAAKDPALQEAAGALLDSVARDEPGEDPFGEEVLGRVSR